MSVDLTAPSLALTLRQNEWLPLVPNIIRERILALWPGAKSVESALEEILYSEGDEKPQCELTDLVEEWFAHTFSRVFHLDWVLLSCEVISGDLRLQLLDETRFEVFSTPISNAQRRGEGYNLFVDWRVLFEPTPDWLRFLQSIGAYPDMIFWWQHAGHPLWMMARYGFRLDLGQVGCALDYTCPKRLEIPHELAARIRTIMDQDEWWHDQKYISDDYEAQKYFKNVEECVSRFNAKAAPLVNGWLEEYGSPVPAFVELRYPYEQSIESTPEVFLTWNLSKTYRLRPDAFSLCQSLGCYDVVAEAQCC